MYEITQSFRQCLEFLKCALLFSKYIVPVLSAALRTRTNHSDFNVINIQLQPPGAVYLRVDSKIGRLLFKDKNIAFDHCLPTLKQSQRLVNKSASASQSCKLLNV